MLYKLNVVNYSSSYPVEYLAGGSAQNSVRLVARLTSDHIQQQQGGEGNNHQHHHMLLPDPFPSYVIGKIGSDRTGIILRHLLAQDGVRTRYYKTHYSSSRTMGKKRGRRPEPNRAKVIRHL